jgi:hypothetical protein
MRRPGDLSEVGDERFNNMEQVVLKPLNLPEQLRISANDLSINEHPSILDLLNQAHPVDSLPGKIVMAIWEWGRLKEITLAEYTEQDERMWYGGKCYVPEGDQLGLRLNQENHNTALAGHPGRDKTFDLLDRRYYWKDMLKQVDQCERNCHSCQQSKTARHAMFGVL